jgi:hypothetical protein
LEELFLWNCCIKSSQMLWQKKRVVLELRIFKIRIPFSLYHKCKIFIIVVFSVSPFILDFFKNIREMAKRNKYKLMYYDSYIYRRLIRKYRCQVQFIWITFWLDLNRKGSKKRIPWLKLLYCRSSLLYLKNNKRFSIILFLFFISFMNFTLLFMEIH